jgi:hypothetical protein
LRGWEDGKNEVTDEWIDARCKAALVVIRYSAMVNQFGLADLAYGTDD